MLSVRSAKGTRYRHVVFTGVRSAGRVLNFAPASPASEIGPAQASPPQRDPSQRRAIPESLHPDETAFIRWLFDRAGLEARSYRNETLRRRLRACLRALRTQSPGEARRLLQQRPDMIPLAVNAIVIGVTSFFRDSAVFDQLTYQALPFLASGAAKTAPRVWSVGCSSGEELYSVAILLAEMGVLHQSILLGSDCRSDAIRQARQGLFDAAALKHVPPQWVDRYFCPEVEKKYDRHNPSRYQVRDELRDAVQWRTADITRVREPGVWDLILCRNMAMYFQSDASGQLWEALEEMLRPGGYLVLGKAERPTGARRLSWVGPCIYRRTLG